LPFFSKEVEIRKQEAARAIKSIKRKEIRHLKVEYFLGSFETCENLK
jgi:hypothetical protein